MSKCALLDANDKHFLKRQKYPTFFAFISFHLAWEGTMRWCMMTGKGVVSHIHTCILLYCLACTLQTQTSIFFFLNTTRTLAAATLNCNCNKCKTKRYFNAIELKFQLVIALICTKCYGKTEYLSMKLFKNMFFAFKTIFRKAASAADKTVSLKMSKKSNMPKERACLCGAV